MENEINEKLSVIVNPQTGKTLKEEDRVLDILFKDNKLSFTYERSGISPLQKRVIEDQVISELEGLVSQENITVKTSSKDSGDVLNSKPADAVKNQSAELKVGHGPAEQTKKRVPGVNKVIAVSSGKGGVGKSTVAVNLALSLKNLGKKVGILDADIYGPSIPMLMGKRESKPEGTTDKKMIPIESCGISFISFGLFLKEDDAVIWRGPMLGGILNQFLFDVKWGELDYLIIDLPPGTGDIQLSMVQATDIDGAVVVSTPQDVALLDARKGLRMFEKVSTPVLGMVENMSYFVPDDMPDKKYYIFGKGGVETAAKEIKTPFLGAIPMEIALREGSDKGTPYMNDNTFEGRPVWNSFMEFAKTLEVEVENLSSGPKKKSFLSKVFGK